MASHAVLNLSSFRSSFTAFANSATYPDVMINAYYANAGAYISQNDACGGLNGATLDFALQLLTAHLLQSFSMISAGQTNVLVSATSIDQVSVTLTPPPAKTGWEWWLATTPYGLQLWALLNVQSTGGWSVGGRPEVCAFRKVGGSF